MMEPDDFRTRVVYRYVGDTETTWLVPYGQIVGFEVWVRPPEPGFEQASGVNIWVLHDAEMIQAKDPQPMMRLQTFGTGKTIPPGWSWVATHPPVDLKNGARYVLHLFVQKLGER